VVAVNGIEAPLVSTIVYWQFTPVELTVPAARLNDVPLPASPDVVSAAAPVGHAALFPLFALTLNAPLLFVSVSVNDSRCPVKLKPTVLEATPAFTLFAFPVALTVTVLIVLVALVAPVALTVARA
jgi:hypothetical protein